MPPRKKKKLHNAQFTNGLATAIGLPSNDFWGSGAGGNPYAPQISQTNNLFENMRWNFVSQYRQLLSEAYVEIALIQTMVNVPVDDALRGGFELQSKQLDEIQIKEIMLAIDRDDILTQLALGGYWLRLYGGGGILILVDDQDPSLPLDISKIKEGCGLEFRAVDMWELYNSEQNLTEGYNPTDQATDFQQYDYYGRLIDKSRVMRLMGKVAPSFLRPRLRGWGLSELESLIRPLNQYLKATDVTYSCLDEFKVDVFKIKDLINSLLSPEGEQQVRQRIQVANASKNYQNALVMDKEDDWDHKQISFSGIAETLQGIRMEVASSLRMPITKLFGTTASTGLGATDQNDMENYNAMVEGSVRNKLKYPLLKIVELLCQYHFGFIPDDLEVKFKPLRVLSAIEEETVKTSQFARVIQGVQLNKMNDQQFIDACNKNQLMPIQLDPSEEQLTPDDAEESPSAENKPRAKELV